MVLSFPIPLRILLAAHPELLTPVLRIVHRVITGFLPSQSRLKRSAAEAGSVTLIQRFGSAANLNIHLHCLVLDGVCRRTEGEPIFDEARAPTGDELAGLLDQIVARLMKMLTRAGHLVEEQGMTVRVRRLTEDHRRHRRPSRDREDPHASGSACPCATAVTGARAAAHACGLIREHNNGSATGR